MTTWVGVIADTHIPQRLKRLPPGIAKAFKGVTLILHAGDVNSRHVLEELGRIAPVTAVAGNADPPWLNLPRSVVVEVDGCRVGLTHGDGGWRHYVRNKIRETLVGYDPGRYLVYARQAFRDVDVVVTGHTHRPHLIYVDNVLLLNPGSVAPDYYTTSGPTVGLLHIEGGAARAELVSIM